MFVWIFENAVTLAASAVVLILIGVAVFSLLKDKKDNKGGCTGNCTTCKMGCSCNKEE